MPDVVANSLRFQFTVQGQGSPLVLLHGFTGSSRSWWPIIDHLAARYRVVAIDLLGHGQTVAPADPGRYAFDAALDDLASIAIQLDLNPASWLGYSMGGRLAMGLALRYPDLISTLVLESATAGIGDAGERQARQHADDTLADRIERDGVGSFVQDWESLPMWSSQHSLRAESRRLQREIRLANSPAGLANSLRGMGQGRQPSSWDRLGQIAAPTLLIAGESDEKFSGIAMLMAKAIPNATLAVVPGAGHAVHLEQPAAYADIVTNFLTRTTNSLAEMTTKELSP